MGTPHANKLIDLVRLIIKSIGKPRIIITDHGNQFKGKFEDAFDGVAAVKGKVRQPSFNGKVERVFQTLRIWFRSSVLPLSIQSLQHRFDRFQTWYNEHRPHAALEGQTPIEAWDGVQLPSPIPIHQAEMYDVDVGITRQPYRGDPSLPIVSIRNQRKEVA
jgi:hypothetical protein